MRAFAPCFIVLYLLLPCSLVAQQLLKLTEGEIHFVSDAPLELIEARSTDFKAVLDTAAKAFAVLVPIRSFTGFNSPLQQEHFYENYMEIGDYPAASFKGKILDRIPTTSQPFTLTLKGILDIHGVKQSVISTAQCYWLDSNHLQVTLAYEVRLADYGIEIPRIVYQKIAEVIRVKATATFAAMP